MCGIFGITEKNFNLVQSLINTCSYRGPDGSSIWMNDKITLGHNLLSITSKPSDAKQPWITENKNILIYNGEIFNYDDLLLYFQDQFLPKTTCDTELLAWLLENKSYENILSNILDSMHAFVFYNKSKNEILLSRDHAGIKPLYFSETSNGIIFSSEIKALINYVPTSKVIDRLALACTSFLGVNILRQTIFKGIYKVLPGETIKYDLDKKKIKSTFRNLVKPLSNIEFNVDEFKNQTVKTIKQSTLGLRKFGIFLSGGIDSSLIALELYKHLGELNSFTNIMEPNVILSTEDHNSDAITAKKFASEFSFNHKEIKITPDIVLDSWDEAIKFMEEPRYNWNMPMYYYTNKILSQNGTVVTMAGDIGDELFGGYSKYFSMKNLTKKPASWKEFVWIWMHKFSSPLKLNIKFNSRDLHTILCEILPEELWNSEDIINSAMALDCITTVPEDFFSRNDRYGMAFSMEGRFPFSSKKYMQYCLSVKSKYKIGLTNNEMKLPVKLSYNKLLPKYVLNKSKTGWTVPIMYWLNESEKLKNKYISTINKEDGIKSLISKENYRSNNKQKIISWIFRSWAQQYEMSL